MSIIIGYIESISGEATVTTGNGSASQLIQNMSLSENDIISTAGNAQVIVRFSDGSSVTLGPNQSLTLDRTVHDGETLDIDTTQAEVDSLKSILAEDPDLSVFEETATGETVAVGGSSVIVDSFLAHNDNRGEVSSSVLENIAPEMTLLSVDEEKFDIPIDSEGAYLAVNDMLTNDTTPTVTGQTNDPEAQIVVTIGGNDYTATNNGDGTWSLPVTDILPEGDTTITVVATDPSGNTTTDTAVITVDTLPPSVTIDTVLTNDSTPTVSGTTDDPDAEVIVTVDGTDYTATNNGDGTWTLPETNTLPEGDSNITVVVTDPAGNTTTDTAVITVDTIAPIITIDTTPTNDSTPLISGTVDDPDAEVIVTIAGNDHTATNNGDGTWSLADGEVGTLQEGTTTVKVTATDPAGNTTVVTDGIVVDTILNDADNDNGGNVVTIDAITEDRGESGSDFVTNDTTLVISGTFDNEPGNTLVVTVNGVEQTAVITGKTWVVDLQGTPLSDGNYIIDASVTDAVGNVVTTSREITLDTGNTDTNGYGTGIGGSDATVTLDEISDNYINAAETQTGITVTGTTTLLSGNEVIIELNGKTYTTTAAGGDVSGTPNTFTLTIPTEDLTVLADGSYIVTATVIADKAGNTASDTEDVIVDTSNSDNNGNGTGIGGADATVTLDEISDNYINAVETQTGITVTGTTTLLSGSEVLIELNGKTYTTTATGGDVSGTQNTFTLTIPTEDLTVLADGSYIVTATIISDKAGNTASDTEDVIVDTANTDNNGNGNTLSGADATITLHEISDNYINLAETTSDTLITISGTTTALDGSDVTIRVDGTVFAVVQANGGTFSFEIPKNTFSAYPDGTYNVTADVIADAAGNLISDSQSVLLDTTLTDTIADGGDGDNGGNLITIDYIEDNSGTVGFSGGSVTTDDKTVIIRGTFDSEPDTRLVLTVDGVTYTPVISGKAWTLDLTAVPLSAETHTITATIVDVAGNSAEVTKDLIITPVTGVLNIESITTDTGLSGADFITQDTTLVISGTMVDAVNNTLEVTMDGTTYTSADAELTVNPDGSWTLDLTANPLSNDATYTLSVTETEAGSGATTTVTQNITTDNSIPVDTNNSNGGNVVTIGTITEDTGILGDFVTNDTTLLIEGTFDNENGNQLSVTINGTPYDVAISGNVWALDLQGTQLSDGSYTLNATVTDPAGNQVSQQQIIEIDTRNDDAGDATILLNPISDNYINLAETSSDTLITISGTTTAANDTLVSIFVDGTLFGTTVAQDGLFSLDIPKDTFTLYPDGSYDVTAEIVADSAGNIASDLQTVILDTSVTDTTGGNGINGADATVTLDAISGTINYDDTVQGITVTGTTTLLAGKDIVVELNGKSYVTTATGANSTSTPNTFSVIIPAADIAALNDGSNYDITATIVVDKAGNTVTDQQSVATDFTAPVVTVDDLITQDTTPAFSGSVDDPAAVVVVSVGGNDYTATNNGDGTWSLADNIIDPLTPGEIDITVTATDPAGNAASATTQNGTIIIDGLPVAYDNVDFIDASIGNITSGNIITDAYNGLTDTLGDGTTSVSSITYNGVVYDTFEADGTLTINAKYGDITFQRDGSYVYTYTGQDSVITGGNQISLWDNVGLYAFQGGSGDSYLLGDTLNIGALASHTGDVSENSLGLGVADSGFLSSDSINGSDALVLEFGDNISEVKLHLNDTSLFSFFAGTTVTVYDENGVLLDTTNNFHIISFFGSADDTVQIDMGDVDFKYVVIESSSNVYLDEVSYTPAVTTATDMTETFTYTITDSDGDTSSANLIIDGNNNTILYDANALMHDGGLGTDTLILNTADDLDFSNIANLQNMEIIDLGGADHAVSNLTVADVINMTDADNVLTIYGDAGDSVSKPVGSTETWTKTSAGVDDGNGHTLDVYSVSDGANTVTVNVEQDIVVS